jgi:hypothetical protein
MYTDTWGNCHHHGIRKSVVINGHLATLSISEFLFKYETIIAIFQTRCGMEDTLHFVASENL